MSPRVAAVVLAAGRGERIGGPKACLRWPGADGDVPLACAHATAALGAGCDRVLIVVRAEVAEALSRWPLPRTEVAISDAPDQLGPAGSIAAALPRLHDVDRVIVTPVDTHPASAHLIGSLLAALDHAEAARPRFQGRGGHPVALRLSALAPYAQASPPPLRDVLRAMGARCVSVETTDGRVHSNYDVVSSYPYPVGFFEL